MMKTAKHTPGPWEVEDPMGEEIGLSIVQAGLKAYEWEFIAMVYQSTHDEDRVGRQRFITPKEQWANARLIAAAPDLYLAAHKLLATFDEIKSLTSAERILTGRSDAELRKAGEEAIAALQSAIAKATASPTGEAE